MLIRAARKEDLDEIYFLWQDCFSDPKEYIDFYMNRRFNADFCAVLEINREVVGMIHLLPCCIYPDQKALYWYAAGIRSDFRNKGLFREFATKVKNKASEMGYKNLCVPAYGLEGFYKSIGFTQEYTVKEQIFEKNDSGESKYNVTFDEAVAADFLEQIESVHGNTIWDTEAIKYAIKENAYCGGKALKFEFERKNYVFFAIQKDDGILIDYHNIPEKVFCKVKNCIFEALKCDKIIFRTTGIEKIVGLSDASCVSNNARITMTLA